VLGAVLGGAALLAPASPWTTGPRPARADGQAADEAPIATLPVEGDRQVEVVNGPANSSRVMLYMHGVCGDPLGFRSWSAVAARFATLISLRGDSPCKDRPGRTGWSYNLALTDRRITAAIRVADALRRERGEAPLDGAQVTLFGYSLGARRAEWLAAQFPGRYGRVAMVGSPIKPEPGRLSRHARFLVMAGSLDARQHLIEGSQDLAKAGLTVRYAELPGARHGEYGPEATRVMTESLVWLFKNLP